MLITMNQADGKWCPFVRAIYTAQDHPDGVPIEVAHNRVGSHPDGIDAVTYCRCVSMDCMAWRWHDPPSMDDDRRGYCGLASKPHPEA